MRANRYIFIGLMFAIMPGMQLLNARQLLTAEGEKGKISLRLTHSFPLLEEKVFHNNLLWFEYVDRNHFLIADSEAPAVVLYNPQGEQVRILGKQGRGPEEYQRPMNAHYDGETIFVFDSSGGKIMAYDKNGSLKWEKVVVSFFKEHFIIHKNKMYSSNRLRAYKLIRTIDIDSGKEAKQFGNKTNLDNVLFNYHYSGGMIYHKNDIVFSFPSRPYLFITDPGFSRLDSVSLSDKEFSVENSTLTTLAPFDKQVTFFTTNSRVMGIFKLDNYIVAQTQHGDTEEERYPRLIFFDKAYNHIDVVTLPLPPERELFPNYRIYFGGGNTLFGYRISDNPKAEYNRVIDVWEIVGR